MIKVGLLSDTHAYWDDKYAEYFKDCDEIWHAGDFCEPEIWEALNALKPLRGVQGNKEELEKSLNLFLNAGRTLERLDGTLQALLLCAVYEINNTLDLDVKVVIQEYVDMAYAFFSKGEPKMVNALLDQIAREVRSA